MRKTIKDIAAELNVSPTTVSLIVNNRPCRVSEPIRQAVLDCVKKYNYTPNSSARALVMKKTQTIGLIIPDISNPFFAELAKGVERAAQKKQYSVIFCNSDDRGENDIKNFSLLLNKQVDGIIIASSIHDKDTKLIEQLRQLSMDYKMPVVLADRRIPGCDFDMTLIDHKKSGSISTNYLIKLGHKKIGCITGPLSMDSAALRYQGYLDALTLAGLTSIPELCYEGNYQIDSGIMGTEKLIDNGATAIFACNDLMAMGAVRQAKKMGFLPGKDISIIGFDNIPLSELLDPPLTTINQQVYKMGKHSFHLLFDAIQTPEKIQQSIMLRPTLIIRDTTAPLFNEENENTSDLDRQSLSSDDKKGKHER